MSQAALLKPAFTDTVHDAQQVFRRALAALSEPGLVQRVEGAPAMDRLSPATYALCLCLLDGDTPVWLSPALDTPELLANLVFHCGCPIVSAPEQAAFALLAGNEPIDLSPFNPGTDRDPDLSCTVLLQLDDLDGGQTTTWQGPGINGTRAMRLPLPEAFWSQRAAHGFPKGLDFFITAADSFVGVPRSTRVIHVMQEVF